MRHIEAHLPPETPLSLFNTTMWLNPRDVTVKCDAQLETIRFFVVISREALYLHIEYAFDTGINSVTVHVPLLAAAPKLTQYSLYSGLIHDMTMLPVSLRFTAQNNSLGGMDKDVDLCLSDKRIDLVMFSCSLVNMGLPWQSFSCPSCRLCRRE